MRPAPSYGALGLGVGHRLDGYALRGILVFHEDSRV